MSLTLSAMPDSFVAGTTLAYTKSYTDFTPAAGWTLTLYLSGVEKITPVVATTSGSNYTFTVTAALTSPLNKGTYQWEERATSGALAYVADSGSVSVYDNIASADAGTLQSWAEATLVIVEAAMTGRLTTDMESYSIAGRAVSKIPMVELSKIRANLRSEIQTLKNPATFGQTIRGTFTGTVNEQ